MDRRGIISAGTWLVDNVKIIGQYPARGNLTTITRVETGLGGCSHNVLADLARLGTDLPLYAGGCIGRDAFGDYVLRDRKDVLRVFVYAPKEWRLEYAKTNPLVKAKDEKGIKDEVEKTDRNRSAYYNYYTQNRWGDAHNYDLAINAALGRETCVKMILDAVAAKEKTMAE